MTRTRTIQRIGVLVLIAAAAAVVVCNDREASEEFSRDWVQSMANRWPPSARRVVGPTLRLESDLGAALVVMTVGLGLAALRRPFVPAGRKWPGRGRAAIAAAGLALLYGMTRFALEMMTNRAPGAIAISPWDRKFLFISLRECRYSPQGAVLGAWSLLVLAGRWKSEADGLERLGRWLGCGWLLGFAFDLFRSALW